MSELSILYTLVETRDEALEIAHRLVEERLVACANLMGSVTSVFHWDGETRKADEVLLLLKTRRQLAQSAASRLQVLHSYECPCILTLDPSDVNADYLSWLQTQTLSPSSKR